MIEDFVDNHFGWFITILFLLVGLLMGFGLYHADKADKQELQRVEHLTHEQYCSERFYGQRDQRCIGFFAPRVNPQ